MMHGRMPRRTRWDAAVAAEAVASGRAAARWLRAGRERLAFGGRRLARGGAAHVGKARESGWADASLRETLGEGE
eukprot:5892641-Prymnesium_polylepis.1